MGKEQELFKAKALYRANRTVIDLTRYLIAFKMRIDAKENLLGLFLLWGVVTSRPLGQCRVQV